MGMTSVWSALLIVSLIAGMSACNENRTNAHSIAKQVLDGDTLYRDSTGSCHARVAGGERRSFICGSLVLTLREGAPADDLNALFAELQRADQSFRLEGERVPAYASVHLIVPPGSEASALRRLRAHPAVTSANVNISQGKAF